MKKPNKVYAKQIAITGLEPRPAHRPPSGRKVVKFYILEPLHMAVLSIAAQEKIPASRALEVIIQSYLDHKLATAK